MRRGGVHAKPGSSTRPRGRAIDDRADQAAATSAEDDPRRGDRGRVRRRVAGRVSRQGRHVDRAPVGPSDGASRGRQGRPEARPAREPRRLRAGARPRPDRDPRGPGGGPTPGPRAAPPRADGRVGVRLLPRARRRSWRSTSPTTPRTDILVQASGDAHLSNFGLFASPERTLVFDANDFDETLPGPWEWDVKRLAASVVIAGRANGFSAAQNREATMADGPRLPPVDGPLRGHAPDRRLVRLDHRRRHPRGRRGDRAAPGPGRAPLAAERSRPSSRKARRRDGMRAFESLTAVVDGRRVILEDPPVVTHVDLGDDAAPPSRRSSPTTGRRCRRTGATSWSAIASSTSPSRSSASGASGRAASSSSSRAATRTTRSSSRPRRRRRRSWSRTSRPARTTNHGQRVVVGQQLMQATSDIFLGWTRGPGGRDFYLRQLWDMKGSVDTTTLQPLGPGLLRRPLRLVARAGPRPDAATRWRSPPISARATRSTARSPTSRRPTRT